MSESDKHDDSQIPMSPLAQEFWALRGRAMAAYASVEQMLCQTFSHLSGMEINSASLVFYALVNSKLGKVLDVFMNRKYSDKYSVFWDSLTKEIRGLVPTRNLLAHNTEATFSTKDGRMGYVLIPADSWNFQPGIHPEIDAVGLTEFIDRCVFLWKLCGEFIFFLRANEGSDWPLEKQSTWRDIFQQQVIYPPPHNHPLSPNWKAPEIQHPPSPE
jgi:hypothetical protein